MMGSKTSAAYLIEYPEEELGQTDENGELKIDHIEFHYLTNELKPLFNNHIINFNPTISAITTCLV